MTVEFELDGTRFTALNGGRQSFAVSEAVSFEVHCATQEEVDRDARHPAGAGRALAR